jgi:hypothetical protein
MYNRKGKCLITQQAYTPRMKHQKATNQYHNFKLALEIEMPEDSTVIILESNACILARAFKNAGNLYHQPSRKPWLTFSWSMSRYSQPQRI